jgi:hypothetical protein
MYNFYESRQTEVGLMDKRIFSEDIMKVKIELNKNPENGTGSAATRQLSEAERTNNELQEAFYEKNGDDDGFPPTHIAANIPAIKIADDND